MGSGAFGNTGISGGSATDATITFSDITTGDVSTSKHGFAPKAPNDATKFLNGLGAYSVPAGGGSSAWGGITGTLSSQTDLSNALNGKQDKSILTSKGDLLGNDGTQNTSISVGNDNQLLVADSAQPTGLKYIDPSNVGLNALTVIPTGTNDNATGSTSASTTFVNIASTTITVTQSTVIHGVFTGNFKAVTAAALASIRVVIDTQNGRAIQLSLLNTTDSYAGIAQHFSATLLPGTYTVKAQMNRISGTGTVSYVSGNIFAQAQQATVNTVSPSRIFYVSKNGGGTGADGSWNKPYSTISAAVAAAQALATDLNTPYGICLFPGAGSTQYSDTSPITITKGGLSIFTLAGPSFKGVQVQYSGSFIINMTGTNLFFGMFGFEINCPSGANWNSTPAALYVTGSTSFRVFCSDMVLNSNASTRHAVYCDNPNATVRIYNAETKTGASGSTNLAPINIQNGTLSCIDCDIQDRKAGGLGTSIILSGTANITLATSNVVGTITKLSNTSILTISHTLCNAGSNVCITTQPTSGAPTQGVFIYSGQSYTTNTYTITGGENVYLGTWTHLNIGNGLDPLLNGGVGAIYFVTDVMPRYFPANASYWQTSSPSDMKQAIDRLAAMLSNNGAILIP